MHRQRYDDLGASPSRDRWTPGLLQWLESEFEYDCGFAATPSFSQYRAVVLISTSMDRIVEAGRYSSICALPVRARSISIAAILNRISTTDTAAAISNVPLSMKL
jgi:hypothetical protein